MRLIWELDPDGVEQRRRRRLKRRIYHAKVSLRHNITCTSPISVLKHRAQMILGTWTDMISWVHMGSEYMAVLMGETFISIICCVNKYICH